MQHRIEKMFHDSSGRIQAKLLELHCMVALNNGSKTPEAEGGKDPIIMMTTGESSAVVKEHGGRQAHPMW